AWDPFESSICAILGQLVSVEQARSLVRELIQEQDTFPSAAKIARSQLKNVRTTMKRKTTLRDFSRLVLKNEIILSGEQDVEQVKLKMRQVNGIGPWTAEYIALRALGDTDAFPGTDLIL